MSDRAGGGNPGGIRAARLIFPCGAYFPLNEWPIDGAHYAKDGAVRISVHPGTKPTITPECTDRLNRKYKFSSEYL